MKQTIRLTENDLKRLIRGLLHEVKYGGEEFHGNNPTDWTVMRNLRVHSPLKNPDKAKRNMSHMKDFFNKEFGKYETEEGHNQFPNEEEYNRAMDWMEKNADQAWDKTDLSLKGAKEQQSKEGLRVLQQLLSNHQPFECKTWQGNGYYPITKYQYVEDENGYVGTWGKRKGSVLPIDSVIDIVTHTQDIFTPAHFSDEHKFEEESVPTYPLAYVKPNTQPHDETKLTESDLRNLIKETLNELEPQTYANYAKGRMEQAKGNRELSPAQQRIQRRPYGDNALNYKSRKGNQRAAAAWNQKYGTPDAEMGVQNTNGGSRLVMGGSPEQAGRDAAAQMGAYTYGGQKLDEAITRAIRKLLR